MLIAQRKTQFIINVLIIISLFGVSFELLMFFKSGGAFRFDSLGANYINLYSGYVRGESTVNVSYLAKIFFSTVSGLSLFFASFYFSGLTRRQKTIYIFVIVTSLLISVVGSGKQKYLGDLMVAFLIYFAFLKARRRIKSSLSRVLLFSVAGVLTVFVFMGILGQRYEAAGISVANINELAHPLMYWDTESIFFDLFGDESGFSLAVFLGYFTNGLYGLSLGLNLPFEWTYFVGNSYSLTRIVEIILDEPRVIADLTYPARVGEVYGWSASKWHSLYAWMASDVTFYGVVVIAGFFGFLYGRLWIMSINSTRLASGPLFAMLTLGLTFSLANNQLMHGLSSILGLMFLALLMLTIKPVKEKLRG
ncbi:MAG: hypothetical protein GQ532_07820 [Methylomarinum sp.]|nr:hypothetical protein [Methylomarinum sp.]